MGTHRFLPVAAALTAVLVVAGCSAHPDKADTVGGPAATSTLTPTAEETAAPVVQAKTLSQEQITSALLTQADMPAGWTQDTSADSATEDPSEAATGDADDDTYAPAECETVFDDLSSGKSDKTPDAQGKASFGTEDYQFLVENIETWSSSLDEAAFDELTAALSTCPSYTTTAADGTVTQNTITALDMPNYGDRTLAVRVAAGGDAGILGTISFTLDVVVVASGNVSVSIVDGGFRPVDPAVLQQVCSTAMAKVNAVS